MRILYLSTSYVPSRRASSIQVMKMCAAFAGLGHEVTLLAKRADEPGEPFGFYGVPPSFALRTLPRPSRRGGGAVFAAASGLELVRRRGAVDLVFARDVLGAALAVGLGLPTVFEAHGMPDGPRQEHLWRRVIGARSLVGFVAISDALRADLDAAGLRGRRPTIVAHDAADPPGPAIAPRPLGTPPRIGYVGNLYRGRGVELIVEVAATMPAARFEIVGGAELDLARWRAAAVPGNVHFLGFRPPAALPALYRELDVLLMPHEHTGVMIASGGQDIARWTSPIKMFEYMASGVPIVASDLPVLQEVLTDGETALIAPAGDAAAWRAALERLLGEPALRGRLARAARDRLIARHTWPARARAVLQAIA